MRQETVDQVMNFLNHLTLEERLFVFEQLAHQLYDDIQNQKQLLDLYGFWQNQFPSDFDFDSALNEIRHDWEKEWLEPC